MNAREPACSGCAGLEALNAAFWALGLRFQWDEATWSVLVTMEDLPTQLAYYLQHWQPHLLAVYDPKFLAALVEGQLASPATLRTGMEAFSSA